MAEELSLQPTFNALPQSTSKVTWAAPEMIVITLADTSNNSDGDSDGDSALAAS